MIGSPSGGAPRRHGALLERSRLLPPDPTSARQARVFVREVLADLARQEWSELCELAISEVVTNAALHAHTEMELHVGIFEDEVCVEVRDFDPTLPTQRDYDRESTTGRGMSLVAALSRSCGVLSLGDDGKVVWFCVGSDGEVTMDESLVGWDIEDWPDLAPAEGQTCEVVLESMPATLWLSARQHHDAILRELVLHVAEHGGPQLDLAAADRARSTISNAVVAAVEAAQAAGTAEPPLPEGHPSPLPWVPRQLDLHVTVPADAAPTFAVLQDVLDAAEALAVEGKLLGHPGLPEIIAVRDWACEQVIAQLSGVRPAPWPGTAQVHFETAVHGRSAEQRGWDGLPVAVAAGSVIAADAANRIVAVSPAACDLLGWTADELVGRRVVTVVPPALREAHVAGFSRHLSTGEAHVLGTPIVLPVLRRDGTEVLCRFLVEAAPAELGQTVYLATIDPVAEQGR